MIRVIDKPDEEPKHLDGDGLVLSMKAIIQYDVPRDLPEGYVVVAMYGEEAS